MPALAPRLLAWWDGHRADLPWRRGRDPYAIWVAEVMLQQTQVATVIPYYERWMACFPTVQALAAAPLSQVLKVWEGLGYYRRAQHLHQAAQQVVAELGGKMPASAAALQRLKGIGPYTAGAIASMAFGQVVPAVDGNVVRVLARLFDVAQDVSQKGTRQELGALAAALLPASRPGDFNQALMELGQRICLPARPACARCPLARGCLARERGTQAERPVRPPRRQTPHYDVVAGIIRREDGRLLISRRPLDGLLGGLWEFPGGKCRPGESHAEALRREIQEELAIEVEVGGHQLSLNHAYTHFHITLHAYHAAFRQGQIAHLGVIDHAWVELAQLDRYAFAATDRQIIESLRQPGD